MRRYFSIMFAAVLLGVMPASPVFAQQQPKENVEADVSTRSVAITSSYTGTEILVFGTVENSRAPSAEAGTYDVVVVVEGTLTPAVVRKKDRIGGIWVNSRKLRIASFPSYYAIASTRPLEEVTDQNMRNSLQIGFDHVRIVPSGSVGYSPRDGDEFEEFRAAAIRLKQKERLYVTSDYGVAFIGRSLFRSTISLPPNVPIGPLTASIYLFRDGKLLSQFKNSVAMERTGIELYLHNAAVKHAPLYGAATILLAAMAGLAAAYAFHRATR